MPVITVSRQTGSGGAAIGQRLAEHLQASYLNREIIREVAHRLGMSEASAAAYDERAEAYVERLARVLSLADPFVASASGAAPTLPFKSTTETSVEVTHELVREAARSGNAVIFGHGAQFILADQLQVLHVRCIAPFPARVARVMRRHGMHRVEAERYVRTEDQRRADYIQQFYKADWHAPDPFHMILNTALWDETACIQLVLNAVAAVGHQAHGTDQTEEV